MDITVVLVFMLMVVIFFISYNTLKKQYIKMEDLNTFFHFALSHSGKNFYFKDTIKRTEYFKLLYNNNEFESLEKFLEQFRKSKEILEVIYACNNKSVTLTPLKQKIFSKDRETTLELSINYITNKDMLIVGIVILFTDISEYENTLQQITTEFNQLKTLNQNYLALLKFSPYIIWKENNKKVTILSEKFKSITNELIKYNSFERLESKSPKIIECMQYFNIDNKLKLYKITKIYKNNAYLCFAHDISASEVLSEKLSGYEQMLPVLIQNLPLASVFIDTNNKIKLWNNLIIKFLNLPPKFFFTEKDYQELLNHMNKIFNFKNQNDFKSLQEENFVNKEIKGAIYYLLQGYESNKGELLLKHTTIKIQNIGFILMLDLQIITNN